METSASPSLDSLRTINEITDRVSRAVASKIASYDHPWLRPGYMMQFREVELATVREVARCTGGSLSGKRILDVGCGTGGWLREFIKWGSQPESLFGIDAIRERIEQARKFVPPGVTLVWGDASATDFPSESFDLVVIFQALCMMTDKELRWRVAAEAARVLKPGGSVLIYDYRYPRPGMNEVLKPVTIREVKSYFPGFKSHLRSIHPFPPVSRRMAQVWPPMWFLLNWIPPLRTSLIGSVTKPSRLRESDGGVSRAA